MEAYIITIVLVLVLWLLFSGTKNKRKLYTIAMWAWFVGLLFFRDRTVGKDIVVYMKRYMILSDVSWPKLLKYSHALSFEYGFCVLNKLMSYVVPEPRIFVFIISVIFITALCVTVYRYSEMPWLSFYMFITLGVFATSLSAIRQFLAIAICMFAYRYIVKRDFLRFTVLIVLAMTIHTSAILTIPMYFGIFIFRKIDVIWKVILGLVVTIFGGEYLLQRFADNTRSLRFRYIRLAYYRFIDSTKDSDGAVGLTLFFVLFLVLVLLTFKDDQSPVKGANIAYILAASMVAIMTFFVGVIARLTLYYSWMFFIAVPHSIITFKKTSTRIAITAIIMLALMAYYIMIVCRANTSATIPYLIWEE